MTAPCSLGDVCTIVMGQAPEGASYNTDGQGVPLIAGAGDFGDSLPRATKYTTRPGKTCRPGDIVLGIRATIGRKVIADSEYCLGRGVAGLRPGSRLDPHYLWHWLTHMEPTLAAKGRGATFKQVNRDDIASLAISIPAIGDQRRIADLLDRADGLRAKRRAALGRLDSLPQSIFVDMFGDPADVSEASPLGERLTFTTSGSRGWAQYYAPTGVRFIRSFDVQMNHFGAGDVVFVQPPDNAEARRTRVREGDVLLTITGSRIGRVATVPPELDGSYVSQHVAILRLDRERLEPTFLAHYLSLEDGGQRQIARAQYGQTKPGLNFDQIRRFRIPAHSTDQQREFVRRAAAVSAMKAAHEASLVALDSLFASLQDAAFSGHL